MTNGISQSLGLDIVNNNEYAKFYHIPSGSRVRASFHFFRIGTSAKPRPKTNAICQFLGLYLVNINLYAKFYQNIPFSSRVKASYSLFVFCFFLCFFFFFFRMWTSLKPRSTPQADCHFLQLYLVNSNMHIIFYQITS